MREIYMSCGQVILVMFLLVLAGFAIGRATAPPAERQFLKPVRGKDLDSIANNYDVERRRCLFGLLKESDRSLRSRVERAIKGDWR